MHTRSAEAEPNRRSALLVDLDGTLTDPAEGIIGCFRLALEALGRTAPPAAELHWIIGPSLRGCFAEALNGEGDPEEALKLYRSRYSTEGLFEAFVYEGVKETLADLRARGNAPLPLHGETPRLRGADPQPLRPRASFRGGLRRRAWRPLSGQGRSDRPYSRAARSSTPTIAACGATASMTSSPRAGTESRPSARSGATAARTSFARRARRSCANRHRRFPRPSRRFRRAAGARAS